jgi:hypothetical protein
MVEVQLVVDSMGMGDNIVPFEFLSISVKSLSQLILSTLRINCTTCLAKNVDLGSNFN